MSSSAEPREADRFRAVIARRSGLQFDDAKVEFLDDILQRRLRALNESSQTYLWRLENEPANGELRALAEYLTVPETYFFRNNEQFEALAQVALPACLHARASSKGLHLLSAGCASGEEAYSMAIVAREVVTDSSWDVLIRAVDLNPVMLEKARRARFSAWALRETSVDIQRKWFSPSGREMILGTATQTAVKFEWKNLVADDSDLWRPAFYDVIFCRNVLMYFSQAQAATVVGRITSSLAPGGYLFLGHAETLRGLSDDFHLRHTHGAFYYERKDEMGGGHPRSVPAAPRLTPATVSGPAFSEAWIDIICEASRRVEALVPGKDGERVSSEPRLSATWDLAQALDLLRREHFSEALAAVRGLPPESDVDPDVLLLKATLLVHGGEFSAAETTCRRLLSIGELNAGAQFVLGLCRQSCGDRAAAAEHHRVAVYLDPAFAMPRLHLGLLARHAGDQSSARRELAQALVLLKREETSRLLLFGGGFNRGSLMTLCESALRDCGGHS